MTKIFLVSINILMVFAIKIFFGGDVKVVQQMQDTINPGDTLNVTLEITKGDREGFAKWQQSIPEGFIATAVEMNGATFSFKNQEIKVIWMELPTTETFTIKYNIETSETVSGEHNLSGKFSYIEENERKDISSETFILTIDDKVLASNETPEEEESLVNTEIEQTENIEPITTANAINEEPTAEVIEPKVTLKNEETTSNTKSNSNGTITTLAASGKSLAITRKVEHIGDGNYQVSLTVDKGALSSFGKIEEYLPPDYIATAIESNEGIFSFKNNVMKVLWMTLPQEESFEIKYAMQSTSDELDSAVLHGVFSYLDVDQSVQNKLAPTKFRNFLAVQEVLAENNTSETEPRTEDVVETVNTEEIVEEAPNSIEDESTEIGESTKNSEPLLTQSTTTNPEETAEQIAKIPAPETAVAYKVQIAASHKEVDQSYFTQRHKITETVSIEYHETWYKYTIGSFPIYKQARDKRNQVWAENNKINDAFVTAYNAGDRISVQEALMISKQKWFK